MIPVDHPLRDAVERHWPVERPTRAADLEQWRHKIDDLLQAIDDETWGAHGCTCSCEACEDCNGTDW